MCFFLIDLNRQQNKNINNVFGDKNMYKWKEWQ